MSDVRLRLLEGADESEAEALWDRVFGRPRGGQSLAWLFREGPAGPPVRAVAEQGGRIVAHAGVAPLRFVLDGEVVRGGYSVGAMTAPEARGRGLFVALGRVLYAELEARGFAFVEMASDEEAQQAISMLNDRDFGGRNLTVNEARPKTGGGGGFGGGGGNGRRREGGRGRW